MAGGFRRASESMAEETALEARLAIRAAWNRASEDGTVNLAGERFTGSVELKMQ